MLLKIKNLYIQNIIKKSRVRVIFKLTGGILALAGGIIMACLIIYQQYYSVDARYSRDNLHFLASQVNNVDMSAYQDRPIIKEPLMSNIRGLILYKNKFFASLPTDLKQLQDIPEDEFKNPLEIMVLDANDDDLRVIYAEFQYSAAMVSLAREGVLTQKLFDDWDTYREIADKTYQALVSQLIAMLVITISLILVGIMNIAEACIWLHLRRNKYKSQDLHCKKQLKPCKPTNGKTHG